MVGRRRVREKKEVDRERRRMRRKKREKQSNALRNSPHLIRSDPASTPRIPTVKWFDDAANEITRTSNPTKYRLSDDKRQLTIVNAQETDAKKYYCQGVNSMGQTPKQAVELKVICEFFSLFFFQYFFV